MVVGGGDADLLWKAQVIDDTFEFFQRFDTNLNRIADAAEAGFSRVDKSARDSGKEIGFVAGIVGSLTTKLIEMGLQAVGSIKNFMQQSTQLTARVGTLGVALKVVGNNAGYTDEQIAELEASVKGMGITTKNTRQSLLQMAQSGLDMAKASDIARVAQNAAVIAGVNSSDAFSRIVTAVQRLNPIMLRQLGINVDLQAEYKKLTKGVKGGALSLSASQKQQIVLNAVLREGEKIAGSYEAAMGSVGKQITSLPRHIEELQLALGEAFQPALSAKITFMTDTLKEMLAWVKENRESLEKFATAMGTVAEKLFEILSKVAEFAISLPGIIDESGAVLAKLVAKAFKGIEPEDIERRRSKLGEYFGQAVTLIVAFVNVGLKSILGYFSIVLDSGKILLQQLGLISGDWEESFDALNERVDNFGATLTDTFESTIVDMGQLLGVVDEVDDGLEEVSDTTKDLKSNIEKLSDALGVVRGEFKALRVLILKIAAEQALKEAREAEREALRLSHKLEDIERRHIDRLENAKAQAAKAAERAIEQGSKKERGLAEKHADKLIELQVDRSDKRIDAERTFRRALADIASEFDFQAEDAARRNDAITLLRLMRDKKRQIEEAKKARTREKDDINVDYKRSKRDLTASIAKEREKLRRDQQERLEDLAENLEAQLVKAEGQREKDLANLQRSLDRSAEMKALTRKFAEEDRRKEFEKQQLDFAQQFAGLEGLTQGGLDNMLEEWEGYFGDLSLLSEEYARLLTQLGAKPVTPSGRPSQGLFRDPNTGEIFGQAGQVSQLLAPPQQAFGVPSVSRIPSVPARKSVSVERKEISLSGDVTGLDPYFQRVMVMGLLEIERNRG